jgi:hypothetical protein
MRTQWVAGRPGVQVVIAAKKGEFMRNKTCFVQSTAALTARSRDRKEAGRRDQSKGSSPNFTPVRTGTADGLQSQHLPEIMKVPAGSEIIRCRGFA